MPTPTVPDQLCSRPFGAAGLKTVREIIAAGKPESIKRSEIARRVCRALEWKSPNGKLKVVGGRVALLRLHRRGWIELPPSTGGNGYGGTRRLMPEVEIPDGDDSALDCPLEHLGGISLQRVAGKADSALWNGLIDRYHYLGHKALSGAQVRYVIHSDQGLLGAIGFGAAAFKVAARDEWIGWDGAGREANREWVLNNRRFLILPWIRVRNLASHLLSLAARQVQEDFQNQYGYRPVLLETFVEKDRFQGTCYRAANWIEVGETSGRGRNDRSRKRDRIDSGPPLPIKAIWLYPLRKDARRRLCGGGAL